MRNAIHAIVYSLLLSCSLSAYFETIFELDSAAIADVERIAETADHTTITLNLTTLVAGSTPLGVREFRIKNHPVSDFDRRTMGMRVLVFLKEHSDGTGHLFVHPTETHLIPVSFVPMGDAMDYQTWSPDETLSPADDVARFLTWVIERDQEALGAYRCLIRLLKRGEESISPRVTDALHELAQRVENPQLFSLAVAALAEAQSNLAFEEMLKAMMNRRWDLLNDPRVAHSIRLFNPKQGDPVPFLLQLIQAEAPLLRRNVALMLAANHTSPTLPTLARLLDDDDPAIVAYAVGGLARFANGVPAGGLEPTMAIAPYRTDETIARSAMNEELVSARRGYYVDFWRSWWNEHGPKIMEQLQ